MSANDKPVSAKLRRLIPRMGIVLILGGEGSGKSNLGYGVLESLRDTGRKLLVYGLPPEKSIYLPDWIRICPNLDIPEGSVTLVDEAYIQFYSRGSMSSQNKFMDMFSGLVRQKDILAIYITQSSRKLDIGLVSAPRVLLIKQPSLLQMRLDRSELRPILADADRAFRELEIKSKVKEKPKQVVEIEKRMSELGADTAVNARLLIATYVVSNRFEGLIDNSNRSPSFWREELSRAFANVSMNEDINMTKQKGAGGSSITTTPFEGERPKTLVHTFWDNYHSLKPPFKLDEEGTKLKAELMEWSKKNNQSVNPTRADDIDRFVLAIQKTGENIIPWAQQRLFVLGKVEPPPSYQI